jgi:hypothetical protein
VKRRLNYDEAAAELRVEKSWLQRHISELPHGKLGRFVYFTDEDIERIDAMFHHEPQSGPLARPVPVPDTPTGHPLAWLKPIPARGSRAS